MMMMMHPRLSTLAPPIWSFHCLQNARRTTILSHFLATRQHYYTSFLPHHNSVSPMSSLRVFDSVLSSSSSTASSASRTQGVGQYSFSSKAQNCPSNHDEQQSQQQSMAKRKQLLKIGRARCASVRPFSSRCYQAAQAEMQAAAAATRPTQQRGEQFRTVMGELDYYMKTCNRLKPYQVAAVWNRLGKAVQQSRNKREQRNFWVDNESNLQTLVVHTMQSVDDFNGQSTATVTHSLAKLTSLTDSNLARVQSLWNALLVRTAVQLRSNNLNAQDVSNLSWAYSKVDNAQTHPELLDALAKTAMLHVSEFKPQGLANVAWAFATLDYKAPSLFDAIVKAAQVCIDDFKPQELSNIAWAYATMNDEAPILFDAIATAAQERNDDFNPQNIANIAWAFATLKYKAPLLFDAIARTAQERIDDFKPKDLSMTAWSFATLSHKAPLLFDAIAKAAQECIEDFMPQDLSMTAWAFATLHQGAPLLFDAIAQKAQEDIDDFTPQNLSNIAFAFAVFNINTNSLTDADSPFAQTLLSAEPTSFSIENLSQLHQYHLWCREQNTLSWISDELKSHCMDAFVSAEDRPSQLQSNVVASLRTLQDVIHVQEEVLTDIGYRLDAVIVYRGNRIGVEVDGPSHFVGQSQLPNGKTVLKHRQLRTLEGWNLVSIPYWEWDELCAASGGPTTRESNKQAYLRSMLDGAMVV